MEIGDRIVITWESRTLTGRIEKSFGTVSLLVLLDESILLPGAVVPAQSLPLIWEGGSYHIIGAGWWPVTIERNADQLSTDRSSDNQSGD